MHFLINLVLFQICWFAAVVGAGQGYWWTGPACVVVFAGIVVARSRCVRADLTLLLIAAIVGFAIDSAYVQSGLLTYSSPFPSAQAAPMWIVGMWASFALTLNHSLSFLKGKLWLSAIFGAAGGPLAYYAAATQFGAAHLTAAPFTVYLTLAIAWGLVTPALMAIASRMVPVSGAVAPRAA